MMVGRQADLVILSGTDRFFSKRRSGGTKHRVRFRIAAGWCCCVQRGSRASKLPLASVSTSTQLANGAAGSFRVALKD